EAQQLHQQRLVRLCAAHHIEEAFGAPVGDAAAIDVETGGGDALQSGAVVDVEFCRAARQPRVTLKVELAGSIVAAMAGGRGGVGRRGGGCRGWAGWGWCSRRSRKRAANWRTECRRLREGSPPQAGNTCANEPCHHP